MLDAELIMLNAELILINMNKRSYLQGRYDCLEALAESLTEAFGENIAAINVIVETLDFYKTATSTEIGELQ